MQYKYIDQILEQAPVWKLENQDKIIIFSDLHLGNRKKRDDFLPNSGMFMRVLENYYYQNGYKLILNGDVEDLQRVSLRKIQNKWQDFYSLIEKFHREDRLCKIVGNHDWELWHNKLLGFTYSDSDINSSLAQALRLQWKGQNINVLHGHQTSSYKGLRNILTGAILRYLAHPLGIRNLKRSYDNPRQLKAERKIYDFSLSRKTVTLMGHTHRPLFESLSLIDFMQYQIEGLIRQYLEEPDDSEKKASYEKRIKELSLQLDMSLKEAGRYGHQGTTYNEMVIPCVFNSGSVLNKNGITGLEISDDSIALVFWSKDDMIEDELLGYAEKSGMKGQAFRYILKKETLEYIFTRISLMETY